MVRVMKELERPAHTEMQAVQTKCDFPDCGAMSPHTTKSYEADNWAPGHVGYDFVVVSHEHDLANGNGFSGLECHICPKCFNTKLVPWLENQGITMSVKTEDDI
jgi:hypothetical protein